jgi:hypothetical protein
MNPGTFQEDLKESDIYKVLADAQVPLDFWKVAQGLLDRGGKLSNLDWPQQLAGKLVRLTEGGKIERLDHPRGIEFTAISQPLQLLSRYSGTSR